MAIASEQHRKSAASTREEIVSQPGFIQSVVWLLLLLLSVSLLFLVTTIPLSQQGQLIFFATVFVAVILLKGIAGRGVTLALVWLSVMVSCRYIYWRVTSSTSFDFNIDMMFGMGLLAAELYTFVTLLLGYFQTAWPLNREPAVLPEDSAGWPTIDVYIPTYNEPLKVVKPAVIGALNLEWPKDKLNVYLLDDGRRPEFREFAEKIGVHYITRPNNRHAKAGNINHALTKTKGELIAIFDCDHIAVRSFLKTTVGWFLRDKKLAVVQTPHHFYSPDPFERNLGIYREVPNEGQLFYGLIQNGNDLWNASFFCGSCALLRREALEEIGGIAVGSVTEDAFTALKLHRRGYRSAYINQIQAAGLATESLSVHVGQRVRWARGMAQILRSDCPLLGRGLNWGQRLCYVNAMLHFFYGMPRLVFMTAPLAYLLFEAHIIQSSTLALATYLVPFLFVTSMVNSRLQGNYRHSYWAEVYETAVSWYSIIPTWLALINPRLGSFNVTAKGGLVEDHYFDLKIAFPYLILLLLNLAGFVLGIFRLLWWNSGESDTVIINLIWVSYNMIILGAVVAVAKERTQKRNYMRVPQEVVATLQPPEGNGISCKTLDLSEGGGAFELSQLCQLEKGTSVHITFIASDGAVTLPAKVMNIRENKLRIEFDTLTFEQEKALTELIFSHKDVWASWMDIYERDRPLRSLFEVLGHGLNILLKMMSPFHFARGARMALGSQGRTMAIALFIGFAMFVMALLSYSPHAAAAANGDDSTVDAVYLNELGGRDDVRLEALHPRRDFQFSIRLDQVVTGAKLVVLYSHSSELAGKDEYLDVLINNDVVKSLPLTLATVAGGEAVIRLNPFILSDYNTLSFALRTAGESCEAADSKKLPGVTVSQRTVLTLREQRLDLPSDLAKLPLPFFDPRDQRRLRVPFAFGSATDATLLEAAAAVSGWLGAQAAYRGALFPAYVETMPQGNSIVFASADNRPAWLKWPAVDGPMLMLIPHPRDPHFKMLLVLGRNGAEVKVAARGLAAGTGEYSGDTALVEEQVGLPARQPYDAPKWLVTDRSVTFTSLDELNFRVPPDLFTWRSSGIPMEFSYKPTPQELALAGIKVNFNGYGHLFRFEDANAGVLDLFRDVPQGEYRFRTRLPAENLNTYNQLHFYSDGGQEGGFAGELPGCGDSALAAGTAGDPSGGGRYTLDFSGLPHYTTLPDLAKFANYGYPFSRYADLSETAVVLPPAPSQSDISAYLTLMGHMGRMTGAAPVAVKVIAPNQMAENSERDLIVLGSLSDQPLLQQWRSSLPLELDRPQQRIKREERFHEWFEKRFDTQRWQERHNAADLLATRFGRNASAIMAFESPLSGGRSVVVFTGGAKIGYAAAIEGMTEPQTVSAIHGDTVLLSGGRVSSFALGERYSVGTLPLITAAYWYLSERPYLIVLLVVTAIALLAFQSHQSLSRRARMRLNIKTV